MSKAETAKSCIVFGIPRTGNHLVMKLLGMMGFEGWWGYVGKPLGAIFDMPSQGHYCFGAHLVCKPRWIDILKAKELKGIQITRDIRDVIISTAFDSSRVSGKPVGNETILMVINALYKKWWVNEEEGWADCPLVYHTTFEKLVGAKGQGDDEVQRREISAIADYLEISLEGEELDKVVGDLFGSSPWKAGFRTGQIGTWREHLTKEHLELIEAIQKGIA